MFDLSGVLGNLVKFLCSSFIGRHLEKGVFIIVNHCCVRHTVYLTKGLLLDTYSAAGDPRQFSRS